MRIWITGSKGMLGNEVLSALRSEGAFRCFGTDRELDITSREAVLKFVDDTGPVDWIVNCAAWTAVDAAEDRPDDARNLNCWGPRNLAEAALSSSAALLHVSTDYVFSGESRRPCQPDDCASPQSAYGRTKREGEVEVQSAIERHIILRTSWLYGASGNNFVSTMIRLMRERERIGVVSDQYGLPTNAHDLAAAMVAIIRSSTVTPHWGVYHYTNAPQEGQETTGISWFQFAQAIHQVALELELLSSPCNIEPLSTQQYPTKAKRPAYSVLDCRTTEAAFGITRPVWRDSLTRFVKQRKDPAASDTGRVTNE